MMLDSMKHNYFQRLRKLYDQGKIPSLSLTLVDIYHDDWCGIYRDNYCNCDPEIQLRLRPILMTSFAFILGVVPLVLASGAEAQMRRTLALASLTVLLG